MKLIPIITLGHEHLYYDFIHIWLLQALGAPIPDRDREKMDQLIQSTVRHQPPIETMYLLSCFTMYRSYNSPGSCAEILRHGMAALPRSWRLPFTRGFIEAFILKQPLEAARYYLLASTRPGAPPYVKRVAVKLAKNESLTREDARKSIETLLQNDHDHRFKQFLFKNRPDLVRGGPGDE